jgi:hypothetical protein
MSSLDTILKRFDPHDSWVVGQEPYVSLHLLGASLCAR